jgi:hypothetical protein
MSIEGIALIFLGIAWGAQIFLRSFFVRYIKTYFLCSAAVIFSTTLYWSYLQYSVWKSGGLTQFLLPPHQSIGYFLSYVFVRIVGPWLFSLCVAFLLKKGMEFLNRRFEERFFEAREPWIVCLAVFLTGYPGFFFYLAFIALLAVLLVIIYTVASRGRAPLYYLWLPGAILAIILKMYFIPQPILNSFILGNFWSL